MMLNESKYGNQKLPIPRLRLCETEVYNIASMNIPCLIRVDAVSMMATLRTKSQQARLSLDIVLIDNVFKCQK